MAFGPGKLLILIAAQALAAAAIYLGATQVPILEHVDLLLLSGLIELGHGALRKPTLLIIATCDPVPFSALVAVVLAYGSWKRRFREVGCAALILLGANLTAHLLKLLLATPRPQLGDHAIGAAAWPSGHTTAAISLAVALVIVAPRDGRAAACAGAFAVSIAYALLLAGEHYPSDVLGALPVTGIAACVSISCLRGRGHRSPARELERPAVGRSNIWRHVTAPLGALTVLGAIVLTSLGAFVIWLTPEVTVDRAEIEMALLAAIAAGSLTLLSAVAVAAPLLNQRGSARD